ncbi:MAG: histidinol-phosphatase, partial [Acidaminococcaceae bacterium]|nr:histidinol-phosphatase [Acidaminococcaceae bacterium]
MFDTHNHCEFSCDSKMTLAQAAVTAEKLGIGMILTEHWDYEYPTNPEMFLFDRDVYFKQNLPLRSHTVLLGIEVGMQPHLAEKEDRVAEGYPFDYVIGSIHMMNRLDLYEETTY